MQVSKRVLAVIPVALWGLALTGTAHASKVYQGNDVSGGTNANRQCYVCDREGDGHGVHADLYSFANNKYRVDDKNGHNSPCYKSARLGSGLMQHRTVEEINNWPDKKSRWSYH
ncbi:MAG: hypothetical protein ACRDQA_01875 [Nocardioidaceae bacterium]